MKTKQVIERARRWCKPYRVTKGKKFRLKDVDPGDNGKHTAKEKKEAKEALQEGVEALAEMQDMLYGQDRWSVLLVFQAMDAAGKDGTIKHVMSGVNPQGCQVSSFKAQRARTSITTICGAASKSCRSAVGSAFSTVVTTKRRSRSGCIRNFSRGRSCRSERAKRIWDERFQDIRTFERYLTAMERSS